MSTVLLFENREYIASRDAALDSGYSLDYISKLCRSKKLNAKLIGKSWFVEKDSLELFLQSQERIKIENQKRLSRERRSDYRTIRLQESVVKLRENISETASNSAKGIFSRFPAIASTLTLAVLLYAVVSGTISISNISNRAQSALADAANTIGFIGDLASQNQTAWNAFNANMQTAMIGVSEATTDLQKNIGFFVNEMNHETMVSHRAIGASANTAISALTTTGKNIGSNIYAVLLTLHDTAIVYVNGLWGHMAFVAPQSREISEAPKSNTNTNTNTPTTEDSGSPQGMVVVPSNGTPSADAEQISRIQKTFSDKVSVIPAEDGESGIIRPEFKDTKGSDYVYVLVPVGGGEQNSGSVNTGGTKP